MGKFGSCLIEPHRARVDGLLVLLANRQGRRGGLDLPTLQRAITGRSEVLAPSPTILIAMSGRIGVSTRVG